MRSKTNGGIMGFKCEVNLTTKTVYIEGQFLESLRQPVVYSPTYSGKKQTSFFMSTWLWTFKDDLFTEALIGHRHCFTS